jgi:SAM-dependent methyltransferase
MDAEFDRLLAEAEDQGFTGWDFSYVEGRYEVEPLPWDYRGRIEERARGARSLVDLGTGGGEFLSSLRGRPRLTVATEGWMPNVPVAAARLAPLGMHVVAVEGAPDNSAQVEGEEQGRLPFRDARFDVVIDRHEAFRATEVSRVLRPGGVFITQQVGSRNEIEVNQALGAGPPCRSPTDDQYVGQLERAGLEVVDAAEALPEKRYLDVGALAYNFLAYVDQLPGFTVDAYRDRLYEIHQRIRADGAFTVHHHRMFFEARKPRRARTGGASLRRSVTTV